jgi:glutamine synthetase
VEDKKINDYVSESDEHRREAKALAEKLRRSTEEFEIQYKLRVNEILRQKMVQEIEQIQKEVMSQVDEKEEEIRKFPFLHNREVTWIYGFPYQVGPNTLI